MRNWTVFAQSNVRDGKSLFLISPKCKQKEPVPPGKCQQKPTQLDSSTFLDSRTTDVLGIIEANIKENTVRSSLTHFI